jgi:predicted kinase
MKNKIKQILREEVQKNSLGVTVTRPDKVLIICRGVPGSGKSTKAKSLVGEGVIHSTDTLIEATGDYRGFFEEMVKAKNFTNLSRMHSKNLANAKKSMDEGVSPVVIDNTNLKANEAKAYVVHALKLGYADENIQIVDIGTGGLTAEALAARNQHGVPLEKIEKMVKSHKSVGPLTLKKILESKDMYPDSNILYSAVVLDEKSRSLLLDRFSKYIPEGWKTIAHHMTIAFGKSANKEDLGKEVELMTKRLGKSDMAIAVEVEGYPSNNAIPHVTLAVNPNGGKPVMSNQITDWKPTERLKIRGTVTNIEK